MMRSDGDLPVRHRHRVEPDVLRTGCGREVAVGRIQLDELGSPVGRVTLDIDCEPLDRREVWASFTPDEARRLAARLYAHAAVVEQELADATGRAPAAAGKAEPETAELDVRFVSGESYSITVRGHQVLVDQPAAIGGADAAATPTELLVASLASCVAFYAGRFLSRHQAGRDGLRVTAEYDMATDRPARVTAVRMRVMVPPGLPESRRPAMQKVVEHCTVHNTLHQAPDVTIELVQDRTPHQG